MNESSLRLLLKQEVPKIIKSLNRKLREKSTDAEVGTFSFIQRTCGCAALSGIEKALSDKSSTSNLIFTITSRLFLVLYYRLLEIDTINSRSEKMCNNGFPNFTETTKMKGSFFSFKTNSKNQFLSRQKYFYFKAAKEKIRSESRSLLFF